MEKLDRPDCREPADTAESAYRNQPLPLFQTQYWACVKQHTGWNHFYLLQESESESESESETDKKNDPVLCLVKKIFPGISMVYIPGLISAQRTHSQAEMKHLAAAAKHRAGRGCMFVRIDSFELVHAEGNTVSDIPFMSFIPFSSGSFSVLKKGVPLRSDVEVQPTCTVVVDCRQPIEAIRNRYKSRVSRILRKKTKAGEAETVCRKFSAGDVNARLFSRWYELYAATAARGHFSARSKSYIQRILSCGCGGGTGNEAPGSVQVSLFVAYCGEELSAGVIIAETENAAWYLYGASSEKHLKQGVMYRLQDAVIADVSSRVSWYDMYGTAPEDMPQHPLSGLNLFKKGFGGFSVRRTGIIDVSYHTVLYSLFRRWERGHSRRRQSN